jgi:hypothetical protein
MYFKKDFASNNPPWFLNIDRLIKLIRKTKKTKKKQVDQGYHSSLFLDIKNINI